VPRFSMPSKDVVARAHTQHVARGVRQYWGFTGALPGK
jgi:hypothetical protein